MTQESAVTAHRAVHLLSHLDDLQVNGAVWVVLPIVVISDLFCTFDHYAAWSLGAWTTAYVLILLSIALHGVWRLGMTSLPLAAMGAVALGAFVFLALPGWRPPAVLGLAMYLVPTAVGLALWVRVLEIRRPVVPDMGAPDRSVMDTISWKTVCQSGP